MENVGVNFYLNLALRQNIVYFTCIDVLSMIIVEREGKMMANCVKGLLHIL